MKKLIVGTFLLVTPVPAWAQCNIEEDPVLGPMLDCGSSGVSYPGGGGGGSALPPSYYSKALGGGYSQDYANGLPFGPMYPTGSAGPIAQVLAEGGTFAGGGGGGSTTVRPPGDGSNAVSDALGFAAAVGGFSIAIGGESAVAVATMAAAVGSAAVAAFGGDTGYGDPAQASSNADAASGSGY
jgi:hypothetical protein